MTEQSDLLPGFEPPVHPAVLRHLADLISNPGHATLLEGNATGYTYDLAKTITAQLIGTTPEALASYPYYYEAAPGNEAASIEAVREINSFVSRKVPGKQAIKRIVFLPLIEQMSIAAQNALLKTLEEPPADTVFLCTAHSGQKILPTIVSRLRVIRVINPQLTQCHEYFEVRGHQKSSIRQAYGLSGGNIDEMHRMLSPDEDGNDLLDQVKLIVSSQPFERLMIVDRLAKDKSAALLFVDVLERLAAASLEHTGKHNSLQVKRWYQIARAAYDARSALAKNGNTKLVLTELMLEL